MQLTFSLCSWGAWSQQYPLASDWQHWPKADTSHDALATAPKLAQVPAMQRRRYSRLTKMQLEAAFQADAPAQCRSIFASRHGELHRTTALLENLANQQSLSPTAFSQSVHNTASGIYTILTDNRTASTSIAAGEETLYQALIEAYCQLHQDETPLLLVFGDEPVPQVYSQYVDEAELPLSLAFVLTRAGAADKPQLAISQRLSGAANGDALSYGALLHGLASSTPVAGILSKHDWELSYA